MATCAVFLGARCQPELPEWIAAGSHPGVEYLSLRQDFGAALVSFDDVQRARGTAVRTLARWGGPYWGMAALARFPQPPRTQCEQILATGEDVGVRAALLQRLTGGAASVSILTHGSYLGLRKGALALRLIRTHSQVRFLCLSETLRLCLIERHGIPAERVHNVGYGVDTRFFRPDPAAPPPLPRQIAAAGMANRDYKTLVAATARKNVSVKIAADSAWFQTKLDIAEQVLPSNVEVRSYGGYPGLRRLYRDSACVVVPLYPAVHACGYAVIAEAMAMGKPVITTRIAGHSDFVVEGETGFYVPPGDAEALGERLQYLLDRPEVARAMGQQARRRIEERFSLEAYTARIAAAAGLPFPRPRLGDAANDKWTLAAAVD